MPSIETSVWIIAVCLFVQAMFTIYYGIRAMFEEADRQRQIIAFARKVLDDHLNLATREFQRRASEILKKIWIDLPGSANRKN